MPGTDTRTIELRPRSIPDSKPFEIEGSVELDKDGFLIRFKSFPGIPDGESLRDLFNELIEITRTGLLRNDAWTLIRPKPDSCPTEIRYEIKSLLIDGEPMAVVFHMTAEEILDNTRCHEIWKELWPIG